MDHGENDYYIWMEREGWRETDREKEIKVRRQTEKRARVKSAWIKARPCPVVMNKQVDE
jgi:hypothetical protein